MALSALAADARLKPSERRDPMSLLDLAMGHLLATALEDKYPHYPRFAVRVGEEERQPFCDDALRLLAGMDRSRQGLAVLEVLRLREGEGIRTRSSPYAKAILEQRGEGQVVNRADLVRGTDPVLWEPFRLEPEYLSVSVVALVHQGDAALRIDGVEYDATRLRQLAGLCSARVAGFSVLQRPKGIPEGKLATDRGWEELVPDLRAQAELAITNALNAKRELQGGLQLWGLPPLTAGEQAAWATRWSGGRSSWRPCAPMTARPSCAACAGTWRPSPAMPPAGTPWRRWSPSARRWSNYPPPPTT
ncbi:hypothetical protein HHL28_15695 [Aerophototrophica crusticola]|uniref:DUF6079 domain-containing protein n=1 Tax=Aerophototrophica crusticola TaxID=1709002 RepID=A0A858RA35_9PROT|nr:hypothetical protein HHL28_15695 [Rhodospirillaceae bacterium B3]